MDSVEWNGTFLRKHIKEVAFIELVEMLVEDWEILDYENLRSVARKRIQEKAMEGTLCGFHRVDIDMHKAHGGKERYYWPGEAGKFNNSDFENFRGFDKEVKPSESFEKQYAELDRLSKSELERQARSVGLDPRRYRTWPRWAVLLSVIALKKCREKEEND